jgi:1,4-dihydroxy-2-naphthoyl-CoA hydrolase
MDANDWLALCRTVRFGDTDAAGVVHFTRVLSWCHEAYEESLERFGIGASEVFPRPSAVPEVALPIVHCGADFLAPLVCGDPLAIRLAPVRLDPGCFEVRYGLRSGEREVARGLTRHLAIRRDDRARCPLPPTINRWLEASGLAAGVQPL